MNTSWRRSGYNKNILCIYRLDVSVNQPDCSQLAAMKDTLTFMGEKRRGDLRQGVSDKYKPQWRKGDRNEKRGYFNLPSRPP